MRVSTIKIHDDDFDKEAVVKGIRAAIGNAYHELKNRLPAPVETVLDFSFFQLNFV